MSEPDWFREYFPDSDSTLRQAALDVCNAFAGAFNCDFSQFRPTDKFDKEFAFDGTHWLGLDCDDDMDDVDAAVIPNLVPSEALSRLEKDGQSMTRLGQLIDWIAQFRRGCENIGRYSQS